MANEDRARITNASGTLNYTIDLEVTSLSHGLDKQLIIIPIPNKNNADTLTFLIDLRRCKEAITIQGYVVPTAGATAGTQVSRLINLMRKTAENLTLTWGGAGTYETIVGNIQKCDIKEEAGRIGGLTTNEIKRYNVQLVFVRGTHKG